MTLLPINAERICALLAEGHTLRQIALELSFRSASAVVNWANEDATFRERYAWDGAALRVNGRRNPGDQRQGFDCMNERG